MANTYNTNPTWGQQPQSSYSQPHLQLEHEFDFSAMPGSSGHQLPSQSQTSTFPDSYQYSQSQFQHRNVSPSATMHSGFTGNQQLSTGRTTSYGSSGQSSTGSLDSGFVHGVYGTSQSNSQRTNGFDPSTFMPAATGQGQNSFNAGQDYRFQNNTSATVGGSGQLGTSTSGRGIAAPFLSTSPGPMQETFPDVPQPNNAQQAQQKSYYQSNSGASGSTPTKQKRQRVQAYNEEPQEEDQDAEMSADTKEGGKSKPPGACGRCKNLKVKCEFKTDTDPCKRCLNGGHDCIIPGRKKRRTPPKREHLLNEIRAQATQIQSLMGQLEALNANPHSRRSGHSDTSSNGLHSPVLSPSPTSISFVGSETGGNNAHLNSEANKAVEDWLAKAKDSFTEFGGYIGIAGAGMPRSFLVARDLEDPEDSDDEYIDIGEDLDGEMGEAGIGFSVEHADGDVLVDNTTTTQLRHKISTSSFGSDKTGTTGGRPRRKVSGTRAEAPAVLPNKAVPFGMFGGLALMNAKIRDSSAEPEEEEDPSAAGIARNGFFQSTAAPDSMNQRLAQAQLPTPHLLSRGIVTPTEAEKLFEIYFRDMNLSVSLLDPVMYTAQRTFYRSPFLFTVICAIASRFYRERPELYAQAMHYAQLAAGTALISGRKNVEMCQAYILLSLYPVPAKKWEDQRSWLYLGLAIRIATDLNLHLPNTAKPLSENHAREMLNRTRVWLNCFNLDRSTGSQYGKTPIISNNDYMANHSENWWKSSPYNMKHFDIQICAYNAELKIMAEFWTKIYSDPHHPTGLNKNVNFEQIATETDDKLKQLAHRWLSVIEEADQSDPDRSDPQNSFRTGLLRLAYPYARLIALSYGFQHAFGKNNTDENPFLMRCLSAASDVVSAVVHDICRPSQIHYWQHGPDAQSVFVTFASAFLIKLLQPRFQSYLTYEKRLEIRQQVQSVITLLGSPEVAIDNNHGPKLYSKFLKGLLASPMARVDPSSPGVSSGSGSLPRRNKPTKSLSSEHSIDIPSTVYDQSSPAYSHSLSPPPTQAALSFDTFAPIGRGIDPFAPVSAINAINISNFDDPAGMDMNDFFMPPLPHFDNDILQSVQSLSDPNDWQDISLPGGTNWMTQFQESLALNMRSNNSNAYDPNSQYMS